MQMKRWATVATIGAILVLSGCKQDNVAEVHHPAKLEESGQDGIMKVRLEERAAERIGLMTAPVREETVGSSRHLVVPYGAILYDTKGETWTYTNPEPLVYVRQKVVVASIDGDRGTSIVTVGATELMGAEHKYGH